MFIEKITLEFFVLLYALYKLHIYQFSQKYDDGSIKCAN